MFRVLDLFSGIGGFSLGLERTGGFETAAFCEIEQFCQQVLKKHWPKVPIYNDIREVNGDELRGSIDVICGGYPCQPFSTAGKRQGAKDDRHLWPEMYRIIKQIRPTWVIAENVAGPISMGLDQVLTDLEVAGYTATPLVIPACAVDAQHRRDRVWIVANVSSKGLERSERQIIKRQGTGSTYGCSDAGALADAAVPQIRRECDSELEGFGNSEKRRQSPADGVANSNEAGERSSTKEREGRKQNETRWSPEPAVGRVANGIPRRVDRLRSLGNSVVPQIPEMIGQAILEYEDNQR